MAANHKHNVLDSITDLAQQVRDLQSAIANPAWRLGSVVLAAPAPLIRIPIPVGFNHLQGIYTARKSVGGGGAFCWMRLNDDAGNHYQWENVVGAVTQNSGASLVAFMQMGLCAGASDTANYFGSGEFTIGNVSSTTTAKQIAARGSLTCSTSTYYAATHGGTYNQAAAPITSVTLLPDAGTLIAGSSLSIYGWR